MPEEMHVGPDLGPLSARGMPARVTELPCFPPDGWWVGGKRAVCQGRGHTSTCLALLDGRHCPGLSLCLYVCTRVWCCSGQACGQVVARTPPDHVSCLWSRGGSGLENWGPSPGQPGGQGGQRFRPRLGAQRPTLSSSMDQVAWGHRLCF